MFYFFYGDRNKNKKTINKTVETLHNKKPEAEIFKLNAEKISFAEVENLSGGSGLFEQKSIVVLNEIAERFEESEIKKIISLISDSENIFLWFEEKIPAEILREIRKKAGKVLEIKKEKKENNFNIFSLGDALANEDKKKLWLLYQKAIKNNFTPEEITGTLFWKLKTIFLYKKSKKVKNQIDRLVEIYHRSRETGGNLEIELEKFILK